jgi:uncharacterized protein YndB with AHSA1/START domain
VAEPFRLLPGGVGISMTREFDASPEAVWKEWTAPEAFADWFGGPAHEVPLETVSMDVRAGGAWRLTMLTGDDRRPIEWRGEYLEVDPPNRLVFTITDDPKATLLGVVTVVLTGLGDGRTRMEVEQRGSRRPPGAFERAANGWLSFFDRIAERLAQVRSPGSNDL